MPAAGGQEDAADHQREPQGKEGHQIAEHDLPEHRRPVEGQERDDAAERERGHPADAEREPGCDRAQPVADGRQIQLPEALTGPRGHPPEQPFGAESQGHEPAEEKQDLDQAAILEIGDEARPRLLEIGRQHREGGRERSEVLPDRGHRSGEVALDPRLLGGSGRRGSVAGGALRLEPVAHPRISQQIEQLADAWRRLRAGTRRRALGQGRRGGDCREQGQRKHARSNATADSAKRAHLQLP